jgi:hypothetical protein
MDHLDSFRPHYEEKVEDVNQRLAALITKIKQYAPENIAEIIAGIPKDEESYYDLGWVTVPDPRDKNNPEKAFEMLPRLNLDGSLSEDEDKMGPLPDEVGSLTLIGRMPTGKEGEVGIMHISSRYGEPKLFLGPRSEICYWNTADAEIFLDLAESVFEELERQTTAQ